MPDGQSLETLTAEDFRGIAGDRFLVTGPADPAEVELVEISESAAGARDGFRAPFSLLFRGPLTPVMPQGIYRMEHEGIGAFDVFIVPVGPAPAPVGQKAGAMRYEVVFG
jgi:hypothetical protein